TLSALSLAAKIPNGTRVSVRTVSRMDSGTARAGQGWDGSLAKDVVVNGTTYAHAGDPVHGVISVAKDSGRLHAPGILSIRVTSVSTIRGRPTPLPRGLLALRSRRRGRSFLRR